MAALEASSFQYKNMTDLEVRNYTGIEKRILKVIDDMVEWFSPLN